MYKSSQIEKQQAEKWCVSKCNRFRKRYKNNGIHQNYGGKL